MVLSGMSNMEQLLDNLHFMTDFKPLNQEELAAVKKVQTILRNQGLIPCTDCRYCTEVCPQSIAIPELFTALNAKRQNETVQALSNPVSCLGCGKCEDICPQQLKIRELLTVAAEELRL